MQNQKQKVRLSSRSLSHYICDTLNIEFGSEAFDAVFSATLEHICANTNIKVYHRQLSNAVDFSQLEMSPAQFRLSVSDSGYVCAELKFYCTTLCLMREVTKLDAESLYPQYNVCLSDATQTYKSLLANPSMCRVVRKSVKDRNIKADAFSPKNLRQIKSKFAEFAPALHKHIRIISSKKLTFIRKSFNMTHDDFWSELLIYCLRAYYKSVPNDFSDLKQLNYLRRSITNRALNIIDCYTSQKRQQLVNMGTDNGDGAKFVLMVTAESQLPIGADGEVQSLDSMCESDCWTNAADQQDSRLSIQAMLERYKNTKRGAILAVFSGHDVPQFSSWLRKRRILRSADKNCQDILNARSKDERVELVAEFLKVKPQSIEKALGEFANALGYCS